MERSPFSSQAEALLLISLLQQREKKGLIALLFSAAQANNFGWGEMMRNQLGF